MSYDIDNTKLCPECGAELESDFVSDIDLSNGSVDISICYCPECKYVDYCSADVG